MLDPSEALQRAIYYVLTDIEGLAVYDAVPPEAERAYPYATIGAAQTSRLSAECMNGRESFRDVHVWSKIEGSLQTINMGDAVQIALHDADLDLSTWGHKLLALRFENGAVRRDPDGQTTHGIYTFRALTQPLC